MHRCPISNLAALCHREHADCPLQGPASNSCSEGSKVGDSAHTLLHPPLLGQNKVCEFGRLFVLEGLFVSNI